MSKILVEWAENKETKNGAKFCEASITVDGTTKHEKAVFWAKSWPNIAITAGQSYEGDVVVTQNGQYTNVNVYPLKATGGAFKGNAQRSGAIKQAQERKAEYIGEAQRNKETGIKTSSTIRMATDVVVALMSKNDWTEEEIKNQIEKWRGYFIQKWDYDETDFAPF